MPLARRYITKSKDPTTISDFQTCSAFRIVTRAQEANPDPIAMHNSYSTLNDAITSDSHESDTTESDTDILSRIESNDADDEYSDMPALIDESYENESSGNSGSDKSDSDQEIIVNQQRYQRVRTSCKDNLPCTITISFTLWAIAIFMQCIFQLCGLTNDKCSRTL